MSVTVNVPRNTGERFCGFYRATMRNLERGHAGDKVADTALARAYRTMRQEHDERLARLYPRLQARIHALREAYPVEWLLLYEPGEVAIVEHADWVYRDLHEGSGRKNLSPMKHATNKIDAVADMTLGDEPYEQAVRLGYWLYHTTEAR